MSTRLPSRRRIRLRSDVYSQPGTVALLTFGTADRRPVLARDETATIVVSEIRRLHTEDVRILGYCVMPDHVHLLALNGSGSLLEFVRSLKGRCTSALRALVSGPVWQRSFHDHILRRNEDISGTLRYLLENPVRAGLVEEWTQYKWCGSAQWPDISAEFFETNPKDVLWAQIGALADESASGRG